MDKRLSQGLLKSADATIPFGAKKKQTLYSPFPRRRSGLERRSAVTSQAAPQDKAIPAQRKAGCATIALPELPGSMIQTSLCQSVKRDGCENSTAP
jgi:hypothetical protein